MSELFKLNWLATNVGSLPHTDTKTAWQVIQQHFTQVPGWPQLPKRTFLENMYAQYSEGFPGIVQEEERIYVDRDADLDPALEALYTAYLEDDLDFAEISSEHAAGLAASPKFVKNSPLALKGQVTGPISWGLMVTDQNRRPVLYDDILADALAKHLRMKAMWQERELRKISENTIIFVDEPSMATFGSALIALNRDQVIILLEEVFAGITGLKGVHCCGNTDWSILMETSVDILNLDAYEYAGNLALYPDEVHAFLRRGGVIAWGITPNTARAMDETVDSLMARLEEAINLLVNKGVPRDDILNAAMITPACGLGSLSVPLAERILDLTAGVAREMQSKYA